MLNVIMMRVFLLVVPFMVLNIPKQSVIVSVTMFSITTKASYTERHNGEYHFTECIMLNAIMASVSLC